MKLIYLKREQIDTKKWDELVENNPSVSVSNFSWFLDTISEKWAAYKAEDQELYFPLPYLKGMKNKMLYQPIFSRVLSILSQPGIDTHEFVQALRKQIPIDFKHYIFHSDFAMNSDSKERVYQKIEGVQDFENIEKGYSTNAKRQIKKYPLEEVEVLVNSNISDSVDLMKRELGAKIPELKDDQFRILDQLVKKARKLNGGFVINLCNNPEIRATGFFIKKKENLIFLKGAAKEEEMKKGAMYAMMNETFKQFDGKIKTIDFDGSNIASVAEFYKRLGGKNYTYFENSNSPKIPIQYKIIKKLF